MSGHWRCVSWMRPKRWQINSRKSDSVFVVLLLFQGYETMWSTLIQT